MKIRPATIPGIFYPSDPVRFAQEARARRAAGKASAPPPEERIAADLAAILPDPVPDDEKGPVLLTLARNAIARRLGAPTRALEEPAWLGERGATFVTLTQQDQLRGCIGSLSPRRPLGHDVVHNALGAAFHDPRFPPLAQAELGVTRVEVSLLSPLQAMQFQDEAGALAQLLQGSTGVVFECGGYRGTFLPQMWDPLPQPEQFLAQLKRKAGLSAAFWSPAVKLRCFTIEKWKE